MVHRYLVRIHISPDLVSSFYTKLEKRTLAGCDANVISALRIFYNPTFGLFEPKIQFVEKQVTRFCSL